MRARVSSLPFMGGPLVTLVASGNERVLQSGSQVDGSDVLRDGNMFE